MLPLIHPREIPSFVHLPSPITLIFQAWEALFTICPKIGLRPLPRDLGASMLHAAAWGWCRQHRG